MPTGLEWKKIVYFDRVWGLGRMTREIQQGENECTDIRLMWCSCGGGVCRMGTFLKKASQMLLIVPYKVRVTAYKQLNSNNIKKMKNYKHSLVSDGAGSCFKGKREDWLVYTFQLWKSNFPSTAKEGRLWKECHLLPLCLCLHFLMLSLSPLLSSVLSPSTCHPSEYRNQRHWNEAITLRLNKTHPSTVTASNTFMDTCTYTVSTNLH